MGLWQKFKDAQPFFYKNEIVKVYRGKDGSRSTTVFKSRVYGFTATGWASLTCFTAAVLAFFGHWISFGLVMAITLFWVWRGCVDRKAFELASVRIRKYLGLDKDDPE